MIILIISIIIFIVLTVLFCLYTCLRIAGLEDEEPMRQMEEKSIENADVFVHDGEPIGKVISIQDCKNGTSLINEEFQSCTSLQNVKPAILGIDLAKEKEEK